MSSKAVIDRHAASGRHFDVGGTKSFVLEKGTGTPVVCMHGVPASCFLYRKLVPALAERGLRGVAFDLPGLGLADRPTEFDYSWTGLGRFSTDAIGALGIDRFHLVIHDIGGPVGLEVAAALPEKILSLTVLNTLIKVESFVEPWVMRPFAVPFVGKLWLISLVKPVFRKLMAWQGINDYRSVPAAEIDAYVDLLKRGDDGRAFLRIMRSYETTAAKESLYLDTLRKRSYPAQVIWGEHDPALKMGRYGEEARHAVGVETIHTVPGKHFLQEDNATAIADRIAVFAGSTPGQST
jgi:pimeloyl-ACP methyl ester carboxylesterase